MILDISIFRITDRLSHEEVRNCIDPASTDSLFLPMPQSDLLGMLEC